ncbi:SlyX family protein [Halomonas sp. HMF6819]|uniref:SlyX family protein n=1 Tax=unclassified Halomonas TaxID=2609666 RepID=UPI0020766BC7|nr:MULTISPECIES: SlyX family protein [unclassified Halomonas]
MTNELSPAELGRRLDALESKLAYQEHWLDTLDQTVASQARQMEKLERMNALMRDRLREQHHTQSDHADGGAYRLEDDVPPHY